MSTHVNLMHERGCGSRCCMEALVVVVTRGCRDPCWRVSQSGRVLVPLYAHACPMRAGLGEPEGASPEPLEARWEPMERSHTDTQRVSLHTL